MRGIGVAELRLDWGRSRGRGRSRGGAVLGQSTPRYLPACLTLEVPKVATLLVLGKVDRYLITEGTPATPSTYSSLQPMSRNHSFVHPHPSKKKLGCQQCRQHEWCPKEIAGQTRLQGMQLPPRALRCGAEASVQQLRGQPRRLSRLALTKGEVSAEASPAGHGRGHPLRQA